jgi:hypothetical protein
MTTIAATNTDTTSKYVDIRVFLNAYSQLTHVQLIYNNIPVTHVESIKGNDLTTGVVTVPVPLNLILGSPAAKMDNCVSDTNTPSTVNPTTPSIAIPAAIPATATATTAAATVPKPTGPNSSVEPTIVYSDYHDIANHWKQHEYAGSKLIRFEVSFQGKHARMIKKAWIEVIRTIWSVLPRNFVIGNTGFKCNPTKAVGCVKELVRLINIIRMAVGSTSQFQLQLTFKLKNGSVVSWNV